MNNNMCQILTPPGDELRFISKGPVKLIEWVKIALLFLHVTSKLFQFTILNLSG